MVYSASKHVYIYIYVQFILLEKIWKKYTNQQYNV